MLRARQRFGKYVIERKLGEGGFAVVYQALDTIEGVRVALKIPYAHLMTDESMEDFRREVRLVAKLEHPNILPLKCADYVDGTFAIATAVGEKTLEDRLQKRLAAETAIDFCKQMLLAVAYAHENRVIHCDLKPDNLLIFTGNRLRLADFGIAKVAHKTLNASGAGTVGYMAPEQAMGKPSFRSDVFALGVIMYRMLAGALPEWPYKWPYPGHAKLKSRFHPDLIAIVRKSTELDPRKRFRDAGQMLAALQRIKQPVKKGGRTASRAKRATTRRDWKAIRHKEFQREFGKSLETRHVCTACRGPIAEAMCACPWCGKARLKHSAEASHRFTTACPRCHRGMKADWHYCPWCYGPGFEPSSTRTLSDRRYESHCDNPKCKRRLMPFMRYCPWCRLRVKKKWKLVGTKDKCSSCGCGVAVGYWSFCPWCTKKLQD